MECEENSRAPNSPFRTTLSPFTISSSVLELPFSSVSSPSWNFSVSLLTLFWFLMREVPWSRARQGESSLFFQFSLAHFLYSHGRHRFKARFCGKSSEQRKFDGMSRICQYPNIETEGRAPKDRNEDVLQKKPRMLLYLPSFRLHIDTSFLHHTFTSVSLSFLLNMLLNFKIRFHVFCCDALILLWKRDLFPPIFHSIFLPLSFFPKHHHQLSILNQPLQNAWPHCHGDVRPKIQVWRSELTWPRR